MTNVRRLWLWFVLLWIAVVGFFVELFKAADDPDDPDPLRW